MNDVSLRAGPLKVETCRILMKKSSCGSHNFCNGYRVDLYLILSLDKISTCHLTPLRAGDAIPTRDTITLSDEEMFTSNVI